MRTAVFLLCLLMGLSPLSAGKRASTPGRIYRYRATAYSIKGQNAAGGIPQRGTVAADPALLPIGARIQILAAGPYSGNYSVADTGRKVVGRHIDVYMPSPREAKRFGRRIVRVRVLSKPQ